LAQRAEPGDSLAKTAGQRIQFFGDRSVPDRLSIHDPAVEAAPSNARPLVIGVTANQTAKLEQTAAAPERRDPPPAANQDQPPAAQARPRGKGGRGLARDRLHQAPPAALSLESIASDPAKAPTTAESTPAESVPAEPAPAEPVLSASVPAVLGAAARASTAALSSLSLPARLEAILYLKGRPLSLAELAEIAGLDRDQAELALITLMTDYAHRDTALEIRQEGQRYSLQLRESLGDLVQSLLPVDLSTATLRTLATIALKKRILQSELVDLRGSGAYDHIKELLAQEFIERRRQSEGRSYWLSLSEKFHRTFAVSAEELSQPRRQAA
jgi:segregation and condensation protein B